MYENSQQSLQKKTPGIKLGSTAEACGVLAPCRVIMPLLLVNVVGKPMCLLIRLFKSSLGTLLGARFGTWTYSLSCIMQACMLIQ
jgi:hypothetical protein